MTVTFLQLPICDTGEKGYDTHVTKTSTQRNTHTHTQTRSHVHTYTHSYRERERERERNGLTKNKWTPTSACKYTDKHTHKHTHSGQLRKQAGSLLWMFPPVLRGRPEDVG